MRNALSLDTKKGAEAYRLIAGNLRHLSDAHFDYLAEQIDREARRPALAQVNHWYIKADLSGFDKDPEAYPCCGVMTFGEHLDNVAIERCSTGKLRRMLEAAKSNA